jgi:hypothetical protein
MLSGRVAALGVLAGVALAGCGGTGSSTGTNAAKTSPAEQQTTTTSGSRSSSVPGGLQAEAAAAAAGDIPDNQVFLTYKNGVSGYSIKYPEGWLIVRHGSVVTIRDKNNIIRIAVSHGRAPTSETLARGLQVSGPIQTTPLPGGESRHLSYTTQSAANPVTGKRVKLAVDRYALSRSGSTAVVDLGTPEGVDNVDAYRLMIASFRWT